jgi:hypothetical protein
VQPVDKTACPDAPRSGGSAVVIAVVAGAVVRDWKTSGIVKVVDEAAVVEFIATAGGWVPVKRENSVAGAVIVVDAARVGREEAVIVREMGLVCSFSKKGVVGGLRTHSATTGVVLSLERKLTRC